MIKDGSYLCSGIHHGHFGGGASVYLKLNDLVYLFQEDESDGYRSYCEDEVIVKNPDDSFVYSFAQHPFMVYVRNEGRPFQGIRLYKDESCTVQLGEFGTCNMDDYYPCFRADLDVKTINKVMEL